MEGKHRILLVEDHTILREGIRALLESEKDLKVVGEANNGREALHAVSILKPDLVLMDLSMPNMNGTEAIIEIRRRRPETKVLTLTIHKEEEYVHTTLKAGASGYLLKEDTYRELLTALYSVLAGKFYLSPGICKKVVSGYLDSNSAEKGMASWETLTHREREVVKLIAEGHRNRDIARCLSLSPKTVEKHRSNLFKKLGLHNASEITAYAIENGLVSR